LWGNCINENCGEIESLLLFPVYFCFKSEIKSSWTCCRWRRGRIWIWKQWRIESTKTGGKYYLRNYSVLGENGNGKNIHSQRTWKEVRNNKPACIYNFVMVRNQCQHSMFWLKIEICSSVWAKKFLRADLIWQKELDLSKQIQRISTCLKADKMTSTCLNAIENISLV
jgi:hypothetical protein